MQEHETHFFCVKHHKLWKEGKHDGRCCACSGLWPLECAVDDEPKITVPDAPVNSDEEKDKLKKKLRELNYKYNEPQRSERGCQIDE